MTTTIETCAGCPPHAYQDRVYAGKRVHTSGPKNKRCTACGKLTVLAR